MDNGQCSIVNTDVVKYLGLFKMLNPQTPKYYNINIFTLFAKIEVFVLVLAEIMLIFSMYYSLSDINLFVNYLMLFIAFFDMSINLFFLIKYSDNIWNCMHVTYMNFLSYNNSRRKIFVDERSKFNLATSITLIVWILVGISWICMPIIFLKHEYLTVNIKNNTLYYRITPFNLIMPISDDFFNKHYNVIYLFDSLVVMCCTHISIVFDSIVFTMCISIQCQLKSIGESYTNFVSENEYCFGKYYFEFLYRYHNIVKYSAELNWYTFK